MPLHDAQPDALSKIYAKSLFELAESRGGRSVIEETLSELESILEMATSNPKFAEFLASPALSAADRSGALLRIFKGRTSDLTYNFLQVLNAKGRLAILPSISAAMDSIAQEKFGRVEVDVFTVAPLGPNDALAIQRRLSQSLGREVVLHPYVDATMIGGVKFRIGDQLIDASLSTQLRNLKDQFDVNGLGRLRAKFDRIVGE